MAAERSRILAQITIPPLPSFTIPTDLVTSTAGRHIASVLQTHPGLYQGIAVLDARCGATGQRPADAGASMTGKAAAGSYDSGGVHVRIAGDGTGVYRSGAVSVSVLADGAGVYDDGSTRVNVARDGSGSYTDADRRIAVSPDGAGSYRSGSVRLWVNPDHSAGYDSAGTHVSVSASGTIFQRGDPVTRAAVLEVLRQPFPRFPPVPRMSRVQLAGTRCGTVVRLDANVLFDFGSAALAPAGQSLVSRVASLLAALQFPVVRVNGYTDHVGGAAENLALSRRRAAAVSTALAAAGVPVRRLVAAGFGEAAPLRPETTKSGGDDPAARELDRRVELVLP